MIDPRKPFLTLREYARHMQQEATFAENRADLLGRAARKLEGDGDAARAEAMRHTCRKIRVQALLDQCRAATAALTGC